MSFKKFTVVESKIITDKPANPAKSEPVVGPPEKPEGKAPDADTPPAKS